METMDYKFLTMMKKHTIKGIVDPKLKFCFHLFMSFQAYATDFFQPAIKMDQVHGL